MSAKREKAPLITGRKLVLDALTNDLQTAQQVADKIGRATGPTFAILDDLADDGHIARVDQNRDFPIRFARCQR